MHVFYCVHQGISSVDLRDEIYTQLCRQLWKNPDRSSLLRGWLLMGLCLCTFPPTKRMEKYLLKYVDLFSALIKPEGGG